jgi:hypothetical protein
MNTELDWLRSSLFDIHLESSLALLSLSLVGRHSWLSESELYYDRQSVGQSVLVSGAYDQIFIIVRLLRVCWYGVPSLTRGQICRLQLLLSSPTQSFSGPSPAGLMTTFYCLRFETPPTWSTRSLYLYPPGTGWPSYTPRHRVFYLCMYIIYIEVMTSHSWLVTLDS